MSFNLHGKFTKTIPEVMIIIRHPSRDTCMNTIQVLVTTDF